MLMMPLDIKYPRSACLDMLMLCFEFSPFSFYKKMQPFCPFASAKILKNANERYLQFKKFYMLFFFLEDVRFTSVMTLR